jgi:hypothetical protein
MGELAGNMCSPREHCDMRATLLLDIGQPLRDVTHTVEALRLVGHGLSIDENAGGDAVAELARIAAERLQVVEDMWNKVLEEWRRGKS